MPASVCMTEKSCPWVAVSIACVADTRRRLMRLVFVCLPSGSLFRDVCSPVFLCLFHSPPDSEAPDWAIKWAEFSCHGIYAAQFHVFFTYIFKVQPWVLGLAWSQALHQLARSFKDAAKFHLTDVAKTMNVPLTKKGKRAVHVCGFQDLWIGHFV